MRGQWVSNGAWGYTNLKLGSKGAEEKYSPVKGTNWFRGALMRATWDASRLWALIPAAGGDIPGHAMTERQGHASSGKHLVVNVKPNNWTHTRRMGSLAAALIDIATGEPLAGFALRDCKNVSTDTREGLIEWSGGVTAPAGVEVAVQFVLTRTRFYSFRWQ